MKFKEIDFNELKTTHPKISVGNCNKWYVGLIDEVLTQLPEEWTNKQVKDQRDFFGSWIIELEKEN